MVISEQLGSGGNCRIAFIVALMFILEIYLMSLFDVQRCLSIDTVDSSDTRLYASVVLFRAPRSLIWYADRL